MNIENWLNLTSIVVDLTKSIFPFIILLIIFWWFKKEIKTLIKNGGLKVTAPGVSFETTIQQQKEKLTTKEKKGLEVLNQELETEKKQKQKLLELQEYTVRDKDAFFLGYHFEKTYRLIFPSQMVILNIMSNTNKEISDAMAQALFKRTIWAQQYNITYPQYIGFLKNSGLIEYSSYTEKWVFTPLGNMFWEYLRNNNIWLKIPANDVIDVSPLPYQA